MLARRSHVDAELVARALHFRELVGVVVDGKRAVQPERLRLAAQDACTGGMKGSDPEALRVGTDELRHARLELSRRLVRERDREDLARPREPFPQ